MSKKLLTIKMPTATRYALFAKCSVLLSRATCYLLFLAVAGGCSITKSDSGELALAHINGEPVTVQQMEATFNESHQGHSAFLAGPGVVREVLDKVIDKQLLLQEARRIGLDRDPEVEQVVERLRGARASREFFRDKVTTQVAVSEESVLEAYNQMGIHFQARHILVDSRESAQKAYDRIKAGADFGEVALEVSQADTAVKGGYMGIIPWGRLDLELEVRLWSLELGSVSEPFETREGWNLLYVTEKRPLIKAPPLEKVKPQIHAVLTKRDTNRRSELLLRDLKARWKPEISEAALRNMIKAADPQKIDPDTAVAEIGQDRITVGEIRARVDWEKVRKLAEPLALRALRTLIEENDLFQLLMKKEALAQGYGQRADIEKEVETVRDRLAVELLLNRVTFAKLDVSDDEARTYWQTHQKRFTDPEAVKVNLVVTNSESEAREVLSQVRSGVDFAAIAREKSIDSQTARSGGNLGWVGKGRLQPELEKVAFSLKNGEFGIAEVKDKFAVVWVEDRKPERIKPLSEVKEQVRHLALQEKAKGTLKIWVTKLRESAVIEIDDDAIRRATAEYEEKIRQKAKQEHG